LKFLKPPHITEITQLRREEFKQILSVQYAAFLKSLSRYAIKLHKNHNNGNIKYRQRRKNVRLKNGVRERKNAVSF
jgi:hypothetical protein